MGCVNVVVKVSEAGRLPVGRGDDCHRRLAVGRVAVGKLTGIAQVAVRTTHKLVPSELSGFSAVRSCRVTT